MLSKCLSTRPYDVTPGGRKWRLSASRDLLTTPEEKVIGESSSLDDTVRLILTDPGLR
jgi:hypothetical protein